MPQTVAQSVENNFTKGLITESTGLNFPENAATDTDNCIYTLVGDVTRRQGIDTEFNATYISIGSLNGVYNSYKWNNAGGNGNVQLVVVQTGTDLQFFRSSSSTNTTGVSGEIIQILSILPYATGITPDPRLSECQFSDGNGYLFVYHPNCNPFFVTYTNGSIVSNSINIQIRDFSGVNDGLPVSTRPTSLSNEHLYNLANQGWSQGSPWFTTSSTSNTIALGSQTFTVSSGLAVTLGDFVNCINAHDILVKPTIPAGTALMGGTVTAYSGTTMTINVVGTYSAAAGISWNDWIIQPINHGYIDTWHTAIGNYPSDADVWWFFKDASNVFNPTTTISQVTLNTGAAPKGHYLTNPFTQNRSLISGISGLTSITTVKRPRTGTWFQGRVWYTGVDDSQPATGDVNFYTWTENIYFSQVVIDSTQFGQCYQTNDPTSETLFGLLPTDGGVISIPGSGSIYKLFSLQNALLVFAANGIWYITGSQGIGFAANDYTIVKLSAVSSISSTSFVDVNGMPYFWNEEGIYSVEPAKQGTSLLSSPLHVNPLEVVPLTIGTILTFYNNIPSESKRYARGAYHPLDYVIQWTFRSTSDGDNVNQRYQFDRILNFNTSNKAFYPFTVTGTPKINGILYVSYPPTATTPEPSFKYLTTITNQLTFSQERDANYVDWFTYDNKGTNYDSFFVTGYKIRGKAIMKFQPQYIQMFSKTNGVASGYQIQGIWNYANSPDSGKYSVKQRIINALTRFDVVFRRHKIRGHGYTLQFKIDSIDGMPFDILGWAIVDTVNQGT